MYAIGSEPDDRFSLANERSDSLPPYGSEAGITPLTGEVVRVIERSGVWVRVKASTVRDGWIDAARVLDLNGKPLRD